VILLSTGREGGDNFGQRWYWCSLMQIDGFDISFRKQWELIKLLNILFLLLLSNEITPKPVTRLIGGSSD